MMNNLPISFLASFFTTGRPPSPRKPYFANKNFVNVHLHITLRRDEFNSGHKRIMIMIMIEIQGKGTACKPDRYIMRSNKIN